MSLIDEIQRGNVAGAIIAINSAPAPVMILNQREDMSGEFPLHAAVKQSLVELAGVMLDKGAKVNCTNASGLTPLHYAARKGNVEMVSLLLSKGAYLAQDASFFWTPLHYAAYHGHEAVVSKLIQTALTTQPSLVNETDSHSRTALHVACKQGHVHIASELIKAGAQIRKDSTGHAPFHYLAIRDSGKDTPDFYLDPNYAEVSSSAVCSDLKRLYETGTYADVIFVVEGLPEPNEDGVIPDGAVATVQEYKAHRAIIHARASALLREQAPYRSISEGKIHISGVTHSLFAAVLEYIYSGGISFKETDLDFVFNLAKKGAEFELHSLTSFAESMILSNLNEENVVSILEAAILFACCPRAENYCRYYIIRNFDKISQATPEEIDKLPASQFESILSRLNIIPEPTPSLAQIALPPAEFLQPRQHVKASPMASMPPPGASASPNSYGTYGGGVPAGSSSTAAYATPKSNKPKKPKAPKPEKTDSPRGHAGGSSTMAGAVPAQRMGTAGGMAAPVGGAAAGRPMLGPGAEILQGHTLELIKKLHKELQIQNESNIFNARVDYERMGLPDYPWIIKHPMDLGTVNRNLNGRVYKTMADWAADVRRVWDNAKTYNAPESEVYQAAEALSNMMESQYAAIQRSLELHNYDPFMPKPIEWYVNTYKKHWAEYAAANPQLSQPTAASPSPMASTGALGSPPPSSNPKASPGAKKTKAATPGSAGANRKRKGDKGSDDYDAVHMGIPPPSSHYNGGGNVSQHQLPQHSASPMAATPLPPMQQQQFMLSPAEQARLQSRLELLDENQAAEVIGILNIQPNEQGEFEIIIESLPRDTVEKLEEYLTRVTGEF